MKYKLPLITQITFGLYQLVDVSEYIKELSSSLCDDYDYQSKLLILACVEEAYLMKKLEALLCEYLDSWTVSLFFKKVIVSIDRHNMSYNFKIRNLDKYSKEFVELKCVFDKVKVKTDDYCNLGYSDDCFNLECRHYSFNSRKFLKSKHVKIKYEYYTI